MVSEMAELYQIAPAGKLPVLFLAPFVLLVFAVFVFLFWTAASIGRGQVELTSRVLKIDVPMYGKTIPLTSLKPDSAKIVDLAVEKSISLKRRTNGIGLPNYAAGWFKLRNGEKALAFVTDMHNVLYLPTREGYSVLISVVEPAKLLAALKRRAEA